MKRPPILMLGVVAALSLHGCGTKKCAEGPAGSGQLAGSVLGNQVKKVVAAYKLGVVDAPGITVLFAFDQTVTCCEMHDEGWDDRVGVGTVMFEIGLTGTTAGTYAISTAPEPAEGEATVAAKLKTANGLMESAATAGSVTIDSIDADSVLGNFDVTFPDGQVTGSIATARCDQGREP